MGEIYGAMLDLSQAKREERRCGRCLLIGQAPTRTGNPASPLTGAAGRRLSLYGGVNYPHEFMTLFDRANVLSEYPGASGENGDDAPRKDMREAAAEMASHLARYRCVVLLGRATGDAFGMGGVDWMTWEERHGTLMAVYPHPSGVSHWWNSLVHMHRAQAWMRALVEFLRASPSDSS